MHTMDMKQDQFVITSVPEPFMGLYAIWAEAAYCQLVVFGPSQKSLPVALLRTIGLDLPSLKFGAVSCDGSGLPASGLPPRTNVQARWPCQKLDLQAVSTKDDGDA